jgi:hypothetical protein
LAELVIRVAALESVSVLVLDRTEKVEQLTRQAEGTKRSRGKGKAKGTESRDSDDQPVRTRQRTFDDEAGPSRRTSHEEPPEKREGPSGAEASQ